MFPASSDTGGAGGLTGGLPRSGEPGDLLCTRRSVCHRSVIHRMPMVKRWREAMARQLLTPAPDVGSVTWKKMVLAGRKLRYTDMKPERVERAIAEDLGFLSAAHPVRQSIRRSAKAKDDGGAA